MDTDLRYRGRTIAAADVVFIRRLIEENPGASRRALSTKLCEAWQWAQPNGALRDGVARGLMLHLHREGQIRLPAKRFSPPNNAVRHSKPPSLPRLCWSPLEGSLAQIRPLEFLQVRRTDDEALFDSLIQTHHYLGYTRPVGEHLKYLIRARGVPVACLAFSSAPRHLGCRDRFIGWSPQTRRENIHLLAYNTRFLILPWARLPHLASHLLGQIARRISGDWLKAYGHPIHLLETFVDTERFRGTCYKAANWTLVGKTTGRGKDAPTHVPNRSLKDVWVYPLLRGFRRHLGAS